MSPLNHCTSFKSLAAFLTVPADISACLHVKVCSHACAMHSCVYGYISVPFQDTFFLGVGVSYAHPNMSVFYMLCRSTRVNTSNRTYADSGLEEHFAKCLDRPALMLNQGGPLSTLGNVSKGKSFISSVLCKHNFKAALAHTVVGIKDIILWRLRHDKVLLTRAALKVE